MSHADKVLAQVLSGEHDAAIRFDELRSLLRRLGFAERQEGGHYLFRHPDLGVRLNLQPEGSHAKRYQVRQVRRALSEHGIASLVTWERGEAEGATAEAQGLPPALLGGPAGEAPAAGEIQC